MPRINTRLPYRDPEKIRYMHLADGRTLIDQRIVTCTGWPGVPLMVNVAGERFVAHIRYGSPVVRFFSYEDRRNPKHLGRTDLLIGTNTLCSASDAGMWVQQYAVPSPEKLRVLDVLAWFDSRLRNRQRALALKQWEDARLIREQEEREQWSRISDDQINAAVDAARLKAQQANVQSDAPELTMEVPDEVQSAQISFIPVTRNRTLHSKEA